VKAGDEPLARPAPILKSHLTQFPRVAFGLRNREGYRSYPANLPFRNGSSRTFFFHKLYFAFCQLNGQQAL